MREFMRIGLKIVRRRKENLIMNQSVLSLIISILLFGCAAQQPLIKQTQSGYPEGIFKNTDIETVRSKIMDACVSRGIMVIESTPNQLVCGKTMEGGQAVLAQMLVGNSYSTTPQQKLRFIMYRIGDDVKVTVQQWIETQMAFGQVQTQELKSNNQVNDLQNFLFLLGAQ